MVRRSKRPNSSAFRAVSKQNRPGANKMLRKISKWRLCCWLQVTLFSPGFLFSSSVARLYTLRRIIRLHAVNAFVRRWRRINAYSASRRIMRPMPVFRRDELRDALTEILKTFAVVRPVASFVCSIKTAIRSNI